MVYRYLNDVASDYLQTIFYLCDSVANYTLRGTEGNLAVPAPRTKYLKNIFGYSGAAPWNRAFLLI